ncbi:MAG: hypothetical protein IH586_04780 [Anaerolineaceae bacterium]|nr:hypothetical protein [Anaerolineaceae bacterium]
MDKVKDQPKPNTIGDDAVIGLFGGLLGGLVMTLVIVLFSLFAGQGLAYLGYFSTATPVAPLQGGPGTHLAVSCTYGILYSLLVHWLPVFRLRLPGWLLGLIYGLILWVFAITILLPAAQSIMLTLPWYVFFCGHAAYGLVLGWRHGP